MIERIEDIVKKCKFERVECLMENNKEAIALLQNYAMDEDIRAYAWITEMIQYASIHDNSLLSELYFFAAFILFTYLNFIDGAYCISYQYHKKAIKLDVANIKYKESFLSSYYLHPYVEHDEKFEKQVAKDVFHFNVHNNIAKQLLEE